MAGLDEDTTPPPAKNKRQAKKQPDTAPQTKKQKTVPVTQSTDELSVTFMETPSNSGSSVFSQTQSAVNATPLVPPAQALTTQPEVAQAKVNNNNQWSTWLADNITMNPVQTQHPLPLATRDLVLNQEIESKVHDILTGTSTRLAKGNKKGSFPFEYVQRGHEKKKMSVNSLTLQERIWGIVCMIKDSAVPTQYKPALFDHIEQVCDDCREYEWPSVRRWSEEVFSLVYENRLEDGWLAKHEIQMLRLSIARDSNARIHQYKDLYPRQKQQATLLPLDALRSGPPCPDFNSSTGCPLQSGHVSHGKKLIHICTFCLMNSASTFPHSEVTCRNKGRNNGGHFQ